tara:strand:- start:3895 stop:4371 length:477 start_codon:yes stop_codon:yes gene_type:complete
MTDSKNYYCYWIVSGRCSYIGATVDPKKRLKQHCGINVGGARRTKGKLWTYKCVISGFRTWKEALQAEWSIKYHSRKCRSIESRRIALEKVLAMERWTSNAPLSSDVPLHIEYDPIQYGLPPEKLPTPKEKKKFTKNTLQKQTQKKKGFKKNLLGVTY